MPLFCSDHRPFLREHGVKVKMNVGGGEQFTVVAMGMTLRAWWRFPWKPTSRCSINHPDLYLSPVKLPKGKRQ